MNLKKLFSAIMVLTIQNACTYIPEPPYPLHVETVSNDYINETFSSGFGVFSPVETVGNYPWVIKYNSATATSFDNNSSQKNNPAKSWLISSPIDFTNETEAYIEFEYVIQYSDGINVADCHQLLMSANYNGDAEVATWVKIPYGAVGGKKTEDGSLDWSFDKVYANVPSEFMGKSGIVVAFCYEVTTKSTTWEVKNFKLAKGSANSTEEEESNEPAVEYTIAQAQEAFSKGTTGPAIIKGYIVGVVDGSYSSCIFSSTTTVKTNVLIAADANETDKTKCIPVQLSNDIIDIVNLKDNPGNYRREVTFTGELTSYYNVAGLKNIKTYTFGEVAPDNTPETPDTPDTPEIPEGNNIILNGNFEEVWNDGKPLNWDINESFSFRAKISQSEIAHTGNYSTMIEGENANRILYSQNYKLKKGTYNMIVYVKATGENVGYCRIGYVTIMDNITSTYQYEENKNTVVTNDWTQKTFEFTLDEDTEIALVIQNHRDGKGASFLIDDVMLLTNDGGIFTE